jgi:hypothetical protein
LRTATPQRTTPTPHIADFRLRTGIIRAVWSFDTDLALVPIMNTYQRTVRLHGLCHFVPVCCVQRGGGRPAADRAVGVAGRVLELIDCPGEVSQKRWRLEWNCKPGPARVELSFGNEFTSA